MIPIANKIGITDTALWPFVSECIFQGSACSPLALYHLSLPRENPALPEIQPRIMLPRCR